MGPYLLRRAQPPFLNTGAIATSFQIEGKVPWNEQRLNIYFGTRAEISEQALIRKSWEFKTHRPR
jgi:hypothetical protein